MRVPGRLLRRRLRVSKNINLVGSYIRQTIERSDGPLVWRNFHLKVDVSDTITPYNYTNDRNHIEEGWREYE